MSRNKPGLSKKTQCLNLVSYSLLLSSILVCANTLANPFPNVPLLAGTEGCDVGPVRSASGLALSSRYYKAGVLAFHATYQPGTWTGDLIATDITTGTVHWQLSQTFNGVNANFKDRPIFRGGHNVQWTHNNGQDLKIKSHINGQVSRWLVLFKEKYEHNNGYQNMYIGFNTTYSPDKFNIYGSKPPGAIIDRDTGNYLRGDQSKEDGIDFRIRRHPIGDIVHSTPTYAPGINGRKSMVYVGANDGMLHGIDADTGKVIFSYIPRGIDASDLVALKYPNYTHRFFVDGYIYTFGNTLIGALGRGGRGIFALDVSDLENIDVLFDLTAPAANTDIEPDLGYILNPISIPGISAGAGISLWPTLSSTPIMSSNNQPKKVVVMLPNGVRSPNGEAKWLNSVSMSSDLVDSNQFVRITDGSKDNGLLSLTVAKGTNPLGNFGGVAYTLHSTYGGDLKGNIWVWEEWDDKGNRNKARKVFEGDPSRPVTGLVAARNEDGQVVIGFGTGSYLFEEDRASNKPQRLYGIIDDGQTIVKQADLTRRTLNAPNAVPVLEPYQALPTGSRGWYIDLATPEQVTHSPVIISSGMYVNLVSPPATSGLRCDQVGPGNTRTVAVNIFTGTAAPEETPYFPATQTDGIVSEGVATTLRVLSDDTKNGKTYLITNTGTLSLPKPVEGFDFGNSHLIKGGRVQWREILR